MLNRTNDNQCLIAEIKESCLVCEENYMAVNGICVPSLSSVNCLGNPCYVCLPGYSMNNLGDCVKDGSSLLADLKKNQSPALWMNLSFV